MSDHIANELLISSLPLVLCAMLVNILSVCISNTMQCFCSLHYALWLGYVKSQHVLTCMTLIVLPVDASGFTWIPTLFSSTAPYFISWFYGLCIIVLIWMFKSRLYFCFACCTVIEPVCLFLACILLSWDTSKYCFPFSILFFSLISLMFSILTRLIKPT